MAKFFTHNPTNEDKAKELHARYLADKADCNEVSQESSCANIADGKKGNIVQVKTEPGLAAVLMDTMVSVEVWVDTKLPFNTELRTPAFVTDTNNKGSVITIEDSTPNDVLQTIP